VPRILITGFCALPGPNRAGVQMRHVLHALSQHHKVDVLVLRHHDQAYVERQGSARLLRVPVSDDHPRAQVEAFRRALRRQLEGSEYDIVHVRDGWSGIPVLEMRPQLEYSVVFDAARAPLAESPIIDMDLGAELVRAEQACLASADLILAATEAARSVVDRDRQEHVHVVPPGVDVNLFDWDEPDPGPPLILYAGSLEPGRGVRVLLRAMAYVVRQVDARLILAGAMTEDFRASLEGAIVDMGLAGRVDLPGEINHTRMPALIARATVCVAPSAPETRTQPMALYPTKLLEYMACRRAVIAPRRGTTAMLMRSGTHGLLFNPGDPVDLSRNILMLLGDAETRVRLAEGGYQLVRQNHAASATRRSLCKAYQILLERMPSRSSRFGTDMAVGMTAGEPSDSLGLAPAAELSDHTDEYESPFGPREYGVRESTHNPGDITAVEQLLGDKAQEREPGWTVAAEGGTVTTAALPAEPSEHTEVGSRPVSAAVEVAAEPTMFTQATDLNAERDDDGWVVNEGWRSLHDAADEDEGTPIQGVSARPPTSLTENRFVAGELEVRDPPSSGPSEAPGSSAPVVDFDDGTSFTAVSALLGGLNDDTDGAGRDEP
jgi:glycosyltransferase involved in cell wall biosynthesis